MKFTYTHYLLNSELEKYKNDIIIIKEDKMQLGSMVTFTTNNRQVLNDIFGDE